MCCVLSKFYFFSGKHDDFRVLESLDYVDEDVKIKYKDVKRDRFPLEVFVFDTATATTATATAMNTRKNAPSAFCIPSEDLHAWKH